MASSNGGLQIKPIPVQARHTLSGGCEGNEQTDTLLACLGLHHIWTIPVDASKRAASGVWMNHAPPVAPVTGDDNELDIDGDNEDGNLMVNERDSKQPLQPQSVRPTTFDVINFESDDEGSSGKGVLGVALSKLKPKQAQSHSHSADSNALEIDDI
jgi:hypothetical protein